MGICGFLISPDYKYFLNFFSGGFFAYFFQLKETSHILSICS